MVKEFENTGSWAIILGGSSGLGLATAKMLASKGMHICVVHRNRKSEMAEIQKQFESIREAQISFLSFNKDVLNQEHQTEIITAFKNKLGEKDRIKCLVHSVAKGNLKPMMASDNRRLEAMDFNLTLQAMAVSLYDWFKALFDADLFADDARIISFTSEGARKVLPGYAAVSAAKASLEAISRSIASEFAPYGIRSNCIQAGITDTASLRMIPNSDKIKQLAQKRNPFSRLTRAEDVANAVYLLCRDEAAWINGCVIPVDGGEHLS